MFKMFSIFLVACLLASCEWVKITSEGESVMVRSIEQVADCKKTGRTTVMSKSKVIGVKRDQETVKKELETLARNAAVDYGGNTVVPTSEITDGKQTFDIYKCP
ncbi:DUF4156 domain-containing protein [Kaarinaea lacus]